jgi:hypothetical protein
MGTPRLGPLVETVEVKRTYAPTRLRKQSCIDPGAQTSAKSDLQYQEMLKNGGNECRTTSKL